MQIKMKNKKNRLGRSSTQYEKHIQPKKKTINNKGNVGLVIQRIRLDSSGERKAPPQVL